VSLHLGLKDMMRMRCVSKESKTECNEAIKYCLKTYVDETFGNGINVMKYLGVWGKFVEEFDMHYDTSWWQFIIHNSSHIEIIDWVFDNICTNSLETFMTVISPFLCPGYPAQLDYIFDKFDKLEKLYIRQNDNPPSRELVDFTVKRVFVCNTLVYLTASKFQACANYQKLIENLKKTIQLDLESTKVYMSSEQTSLVNAFFLEIEKYLKN
jgi:hypothetical protein